MYQRSDKPLKVQMKYKKSTYTKERVYKAALKLMSEKGYQGATIRDICKEADVSPATFYSYYGSKIDILDEIYKAADDYFSFDVPKLLAGKSCHEQLLIFSSCYAKLNTDTGLDMMRVLFNPENAWFTKDRPMQRLLYDIVKNGQEQNALTTSVQTKQLADHIFSLLRGVCYSWCVYSASFDLEAVIREQMNLFIRGIGNT